MSSGINRQGETLSEEERVQSTTMNIEEKIYIKDTEVFILWKSIENKAAYIFHVFENCTITEAKEFMEYAMKKDKENGEKTSYRLFRYKPDFTYAD